MPTAHLVIVGEGELEQELRELAENYAVKEYTHFLGRIETPREVIGRFTVGVLCSESEGLSNALMEYLCEGKPVVCTNAGGNPELVIDGENGYLYPVGDVMALSDRLLRLLENDNLMQEMSVTARKSIEPFTILNMVHQHVYVYESMLQAGSA